MDVNFGSTGDDNLEPRSMGSGICQDLQGVWTTLSGAALIKCVNDKDESPFWGGEEVCG